MSIGSSEPILFLCFMFKCSEIKGPNRVTFKHNKYAFCRLLAVMQHLIMDHCGLEPCHCKKVQRDGETSCVISIHRFVRSGYILSTRVPDTCAKSLVIAPIYRSCSDLHKLTLHVSTVMSKQMSTGTSMLIIFFYLL